MTETTGKSLASVSIWLLGVVAFCLSGEPKLFFVSVIAGAFVWA